MSRYPSDNQPAYAAIIAFALVTGIAVLGTGPQILVPQVLSFVLLLIGQPLFRAYAMARPNARSSHTTPVPQGGGAPVVLATLLATAMIGTGPSGAGAFDMSLIVLIAATLLLAVTGAIDDVRGLPVLPRLTIQFAAVALLVLLAPSSWRLFPEMVPQSVERFLLVVAGVWFINLTNFMDGIDGITLAAFLPLAFAVFLFSRHSYASVSGGIVALCFAGAMIAFIPFNWHPARLFLGDVGSLPIGLIGGALLLDTAAHGGLVAALILPLYSCCDATLTLFRRMLRREKVWQAHRQHTYQHAVDGGWSHTKVSGIVLVLNGLLATLAWMSLGTALAQQVLCLFLAIMLVCATMLVFFRRLPQARAAGEGKDATE